ncbi:UNVERIFIED_CONTAM: Retrovirus-related Pol polyprotein from transposon RE2 [Sesamum calycinum]|uniref:Retrovirus-related Pol polyprotein from transposon RE2 n=1 Tax=Sesamum calycinum TaxID=2727403 RepID=A0AAW2M248_9LAMI
MVHLVSSENVALHTRGEEKREFKGIARKKPFEARRNQYCDHCERTGHTRETCFKLHGTPDWYKELNEQRKKQPTTSKEQVNFAQTDDFAGEHFAFASYEKSVQESNITLAIGKLMENLYIIDKGSFCPEVTISTPTLEISFWNSIQQETSFNSPQSFWLLMFRIITNNLHLPTMSHFLLSLSLQILYLLLLEDLPHPLIHLPTHLQNLLLHPHILFPFAGLLDRFPSLVGLLIMNVTAPPIPLLVLQLYIVLHTCVLLLFCLQYRNQGLTLKPVFPQALIRTTFVSQACKNPHWVEAMEKELYALENNETWELTTLPRDKKAMCSKWVFKLKMNPDGSVERYKARLVAKGSFIALLVFVDDILLTGSSTSDIDAVKTYMDRLFTIKDLGPTKYFLGLQLPRSDHGLLVFQTKYLADILEDANMMDAKPTSTPIPPGFKFSHDDGSLLPSPDKYRRHVGHLLYLRFSRPDISFSVQQLSQFLQHPRTSHWAAAIHVLRYLKGTISLGLFFSAHSSLQLSAYSDTSWAACLDSRRSVTGSCVFLGSSLISWKTKKQAIVSRSSAEAEYRSMGSTVCELLWISYILCELQVDLQLPIPQCGFGFVNFKDEQSMREAMEAINNQELNGRITSRSTRISPAKAVAEADFGALVVKVVMA